MKVLVCGGRDYRNESKVYDVLKKLHSDRPITHIIQGGSTGADAFAKVWAGLTRGVQPVTCDAMWRRDGDAAGPIRNAAMLGLKPDLVVAFTGGRGTANMVRLATNAGITVRKEK